MGSLSGKITNTSTGAIEQDVTVSGTVTAVAAITVSKTSLNLGTTTAGTAGTPASYTVSGSNLTGPLTITAPAGVELSSDGGSTFHPSLTLTPTSGTVPTTTIEARIHASAAVGSLSGKITNTSTGATEQDVSVSGTVNAVLTPAITVSTNSLNLGTTTAGTPGTAQSYTVSGSNLTTALTITAPAGVELSDDNGSTFHATLSLTPTSGTVARTTIEVRISASAAVGPISGKITNTSTGATEQDVSVSGTVNAVRTPAIMVSTISLILGTTTAGTPGTAQSYTVSGSNLTAALVITAPDGAGDLRRQRPHLPRHPVADAHQRDGSNDYHRGSHQRLGGSGLDQRQDHQHQQRGHRAGCERQRHGQCGPDAGDRREHELAEPGHDHGGYGRHRPVLHGQRQQPDHGAHHHGAGGGGTVRR